MRHNGQPVVLASSLPPNRISLFAGEPVMVACPFCDRWRGLRRRMITPHDVPGEEFTRCPGSGQRIHVDVSSVEWQRRLREACGEASTRSGAWAARRVASGAVSRTSGRKLVRRSAAPPAPTPVMRIATS